MRILHVVSSYLPAVRYGGTIVSVHGLARALASRGHEVHVFTTNVDGDADSDVPLGQPVEIDGVQVSYFPSRQLRRIYWAPDLGHALRRRAAGFDVIHTHAIFLWPLWAGARAARAAGVPYVVSPRGMLERELIAAQSPWLKGLWIAAIERRNLERAAAIHVTSAREADEAAALGFNLPRMCEIPNGVDLNPGTDIPEPSPRLRQLVGGDPFVLFIGRLNWKKGLDRLIAAMQHVRVRLVIAGNDEDDYRPILDALAHEHGVSARVAFVGAVGAADKQWLLSRAQLLVLPSYSENFGNVVLESMAAGCPVIVTPEVGIAPSVIDHHAGWVVNGDPDSLGLAIAGALATPDALKEAGVHGRRAAREVYSWDAVAAQMESLYASLNAKTRH